jgi:hypothetical protein
MDAQRWALFEQINFNLMVLPPFASRVANEKDRMRAS